MVDLKLPVRPAANPELPGARRRDDRDLAAQGMQGRPGAPLRHGDAGAAGPPRLRARRHLPDGLRRLLPDRGRLHRLRPPAAHRHHRPRLGAGFNRHLHPRHHAGGPDPLPAAVRALPQPGPRDDARYRRRLRGRAARGSHQLRQPQVRRRPRGPDHHLRHDARPGGHPRRGPRRGHELRRGRPNVQGGPEPARHQARRGDRDEPGAQGDVRERAAASTASSSSPSSWRALPETPPRTPPAWSSAASR